MFGLVICVVGMFGGFCGCYVLIVVLGFGFSLVVGLGVLAC